MYVLLFQWYTKIEDFELDCILIDKKSVENISFYNISYESLIDYKSLRVKFDKIDACIRVYDETRYLVLFGSKIMIPFTTGLDIV